MEYTTTRAIDNGQLVAWCQGATFLAKDFPLPNANDYLIVLPEGEPVRLRARDDATAILFAQELYRAPFAVERTITTSVTIAEVEEGLG